MKEQLEARDMRLREAALAWCVSLRNRWGDAVPAAELRCFPFEGDRVFLYGQQGIFKPKELSDGPLSIRTALKSRYADEPVADGRFIRYDFRADRESDNEGLKRMCDAMAPLIYLVQVKGKPRPEYLVLAPVFITGWDDRKRAFHVAYQPATAELMEDSSITEKRYALQVFQARLHQAHFRKQVLAAYRDRCAVCDLRARPLLDGAHIIPDSHPGGDAVVQNGIAFCALHHRAFDREILLVTADYRIEIDHQVLADRGKSAQLSLLDHHGRSLTLPSQKHLHPDPDRLRKKLAG